MEASRLHREPPHLGENARFSPGSLPFHRMPVRRRGITDRASGIVVRVDRLPDREKEEEEQPERPDPTDPMTAIPMSHGVALFPAGADFSSLHLVE